MLPEENLRQRKHEFETVIDDAIDTLLFTPDGTVMETFSTSTQKALDIMAAYQEALSEAAKTATQEVREDRVKRAQALPAQVGFLISTLLEHRRRRNLA